MLGKHSSTELCPSVEFLNMYSLNGIMASCCTDIQFRYSSIRSWALGCEYSLDLLNNVLHTVRFLCLFSWVYLE